MKGLFYSKIKGGYIMRKRRTKIRFIILVLEILFTIILLIHLKERIKYENVFCKNTIINGQDCSSLTVEQTERILQKKYEEYVLQIQFKDNQTEYITGVEIGLRIDNLLEQLSNIKERQKKDLFLRGGTYNFYDITYSKDSVKSMLSNMKQLQLDYMEEMTKVEYVFNSTKKHFEIKVQNVYYLDFDQVLQRSLNAIDEKETEISLEDLYFYPEYDETLNELNRIIGSEITYKLPFGNEYVLDATTLYTWLVKDDEGNYKKVEEIWNENINNFVTNELSLMANTVGVSREFSPTGKDEIVLIGGGDYGYQIDSQAEIKKLKEELDNQVIETRQPCYITTEVSSENNGLGYSYVEIDLTRQKVWVYVDGNLEIETDCVTGCVNKDHGTPTGIYTLSYKKRDTVLRGEIKSNGKREYESPVSYWMPFNGNIGLHDATWRSSFGGNIYINDGSHGCINLPLKEAEKLYGIINKDMPIIVYES